MDGPYTLISNAKSGRRRRAVIEDVRERLEERLGTVNHVVVASGVEIRRAAQEARDAGEGIVFVAGGDGTLAGVADTLKDGPVAMAAIPMGTFNFFARGLEIPTDPCEAVDALCDGVVRQTSIGEINGKVFLNNASLGLYPAILRLRESVYNNWGRSRLAAYWTVLITLLRPGHGMKLKVEVDGTEHEIVTPMVFAGSNPYQLKLLNLAGAELPREGRLAFYYGPDTGRFGMLRTALWLAFGRARRGREFKMLAGCEIVVSLKHRKITAAMDGERQRFRPPIRMRLLPRALRIVAPAGSEAARALDRAEMPDGKPGPAADAA